MKRIILACFCFGTLQAFSQAKLVESVKKTANQEIQIPYEKFILPNGLTLLVLEDHSDPIAHVDVTYHVGSAREEIGKSGFAHFFEHMMFQGSDHVADEQHFKIITESGGTLNGTTNRDRTNYFETVPSNQVEKMLWLEADRMGFLLDAVTQKKFEVQRATVKNERGQNYDNKPYGLVQETLAKNLYPYGHPYSWLTIGYLADLDRVNVDDLKNFFLRWYGPNNAVVTVGGDVQTKEVVKWVEKYFGSIPRGPKVENIKFDLPVLKSDRYISMTDGYAKLPMLLCAMPTVPAYHKDEAALDCLAEILGGSNTSILYQNLIKTQKALSARVSNATDEQAGVFQFNIMPKSGTPLSEMEKEIRLALKEFETKGISDDDLAKFKMGKESELVYGLESVSGKVSRLAAYQTFTGNANYIQQELSRYQEVTKADVLRVYNTYIKNKPMVILSVLTKGFEQLAAGANNYEVDQTGYKSPDYGYQGLKYVKAQDNFDRSKMPEMGKLASIQAPKFDKHVEDGISLVTAQYDEVPVVVMTLGFKGGRMAEQKQLNKAGLCSMFCELMDEDTKQHSTEEISTMLDKLGSSISFNAELDETVVSVRCLKKNLNATLDILEEKLLEPRFKPETFDRIKNQTLESIRNSKSRAAVVAANNYAMVNYGDQNLLGYPRSGTSETVKNIALGDIETYHKYYMSRKDLKVVMVGKLSENEQQDIFRRLKKLPSVDQGAMNLPDFRERHQANTIYITDIPKAAQTEFRLGYVTNIKYDATGDFYKTGLMNYPLGGAFNSRINLNLREDKGWTYGARTGFQGNDYTGLFTFSSGIKTQVTDSALMEVVKEINLFRDKGMTMEELTFLRSAISQSEALKYETVMQKAGFVGNILRHDLAPTYLKEQETLLNSLGLADFALMAKQLLNLDKMNIVLAGDKARIAPGLKKMGYTLVELDAEGKELPNTDK